MPLRRYATVFKNLRISGTFGKMVAEEGLEPPTRGL